MCEVFTFFISSTDAVLLTPKTSYNLLSAIFLNKK